VSTLSNFFTPLGFSDGGAFRSLMAIQISSIYIAEFFLLKGKRDAKTVNSPMLRVLEVLSE
jgi:hypothetical protein